MVDGLNCTTVHPMMHSDKEQAVLRRILPPSDLVCSTVAKIVSESDSRNKHILDTMVANHSSDSGNGRIVFEVSGENIFYRDIIVMAENGFGRCVTAWICIE